MKYRTCLLLGVGALLMATSAFALTPPIMVKMKNKQGEVFFHHQEHQAAVNNCTDCHHMGFDVPRCRDCHGVDPEVPRLKRAFHHQCRNCHIKNGGPTECDTCHHIDLKN
ncbi:MAG: cytochrome c family protein [Geopsychrobacter sp.]|nr:cytochrome c family protein [Geopsychrobacter sp.]